MSAPTQISLRVVVLLIASSAPLALVIETALRELVVVPMVGAELQEIREFYWPELSDELRRAAMTQAAWALVGATLIAGATGLALLRRAGRGDRSELQDRLLLLTSIPQVPAILATLCFAFGSPLQPVLIGLAISSAFVLAQGLIGERLLADQPRASATAG